jgi:hypothetical protein
MLHVHVGSFTTLGGSYMPDSGGYQHQGRFPVGEVVYDLGPSTDLSVQSFQRIVGPEPLPVFRGKMEVARVTIRVRQKPHLNPAGTGKRWGLW